MKAVTTCVLMFCCHFVVKGSVIYIVYTTGNSSDLARLPIQQPCFQFKVSKVKSSLQIRGGHTVSENAYLCITVSTIIAKYSIVGLNKMRLTYNDCLLSFMFNLLTPVPPVTAHDKPWPLSHFRPRHLWPKLASSMYTQLLQEEKIFPIFACFQTAKDKVWVCKLWN